MVALPKINIDTDLHKNHCFGCGPHNPIGLKLQFTIDGDTLRTECTPAAVYQGWPGLVHGGILSLILDEAMNNVAYLTGTPCITASMNIRLRQPAKVEETLYITARITRRNRKLIESSARICLKDGTLIAESTSKQFVIEEPGSDD
jgi:acyl-coenzyme A thioesterase PaaI-like protein